MPPKKSVAAIVGYIRVSSKRQADVGLSLDGQAQAIRQWADDHGYKLIWIEEDDCPGHGAAGLARPGLRNAIASARANGVSIVVTTIDRLTRDPKSIQSFGLEDISIKTIASNRRVGKRSLNQLVREAQNDVSDLSLRGKESHISKKRRSNLKPENQRAGAIGNISRSDENTRSLMERIKQHPGLLSKSWAERATWLNQTSVLNLKKGKLRIPTHPIRCSDDI